MGEIRQLITEEDFTRFVDIVYSRVEISDGSFIHRLNSLFVTMDKPICTTAF